mmetsp:Transcript_31265/g.99337  ORF Transcript_31265/g.99337 Transcript_31265/m.99337 type:complete len:260 (+) Transcript_31265:853-1632(+)
MGGTPLNLGFVQRIVSVVYPLLTHTGGMGAGGGDGAWQMVMLSGLLMSMYSFWSATNCASACRSSSVIFSLSSSSSSSSPLSSTSGLLSSSPTDSSSIFSSSSAPAPGWIFALLPSGDRRRSEPFALSSSFDAAAAPAPSADLLSSPAASPSLPSPSLALAPVVASPSLFSSALAPASPSGLGNALMRFAHSLGTDSTGVCSACCFLAPAITSVCRYAKRSSSVSRKVPCFVAAPFNASTSTRPKSVPSPTERPCLTVS